ncbi:MAG: glycosyltransferase family 2 protein [Chitinispirillaceae bacterium]
MVNSQAETVPCEQKSAQKKIWLLSVIIPVHNENENLDQLYKRLCDALENFGGDCEVLFVDDGSSDGSAQRLDDFASRDYRVRVIHFRRNFGQTAAMMAGIDYSRGEVLIPMDADLQNDPADIPRLYAKILEGYDVCSGWRKNRQDNPVSRNLPSRIANALISWISGVKLNDYGCTLKAYRREVIKSVRIYGEMHRFIPIYASWMGAKVIQIPVSHSRREHGSSHYGLRRTFKVILDLIVVKFLSSYLQNPIYMFGGFGLLSFLSSFFTAGLMIYYKFWGGKSFIETPLPMLVVLFVLMGCMSIFMGLIAELQMRTYYESQHKRAYMIEKTRNLGKKN